MGKLSNGCGNFGRIENAGERFNHFGQVAGQVNSSNKNHYIKLKDGNFIVRAPGIITGVLHGDVQKYRDALTEMRDATFTALTNFGTPKDEAQKIANKLINAARVKSMHGRRATFSSADLFQSAYIKARKEVLSAKTKWETQLKSQNQNDENSNAGLSTKHKNHGHSQILHESIPILNSRSNTVELHIEDQNGDSTFDPDTSLKDDKFETQASHSEEKHLRHPITEHYPIIDDTAENQPGYIAGSGADPNYPRPIVLNQSVELQWRNDNSYLEKPSDYSTDSDWHDHDSTVRDRGGSFETGLSEERFDVSTFILSYIKNLANERRNHGPGEANERGLDDLLEKFKNNGINKTPMETYLMVAETAKEMWRKAKNNRSLSYSKSCDEVHDIYKEACQAIIVRLKDSFMTDVRESEAEYEQDLISSPIGEAVGQIIEASESVFTKFPNTERWALDTRELQSLYGSIRKECDSFGHHFAKLQQDPKSQGCDEKLYGKRIKEFDRDVKRAKAIYRRLVVHLEALSGLYGVTLPGTVLIFQHSVESDNKGVGRL